MTQIEPYSGGGLATFAGGNRLARQTGHELARLDARTTIGIARIEAQTELQLSKVHAVGQVGRTAMQEAALLSQIETQLATAIPQSSGRVAGIADLTTVAMSEVVLDSARRIGRC